MFNLLRRKLGPTAGARCSRAPTLYGFVDRFHIRLILGMGRQIVIGLPIQLVTRADLDFIHAVKNVELGERDAGNADYHRRLAPQPSIEHRTEARRVGTEWVSTSRARG